LNMPIRVFSKHMDFLTEIEGYSSLQFTRRFHEYGEFELHINRYAHGAENLNAGTLIMLGKQANKAGIILFRELSLNQNGKVSEMCKITGYTLQGLMRKRLAVPSENKENDTVSDNAETAMKYFIDRHFINPDDPKRKMPLLEVAPNLNRGPNIKWQSRYKEVADDIAGISKKSGLGWNITVDVVNRKWVFDVVEGKDLTQEQDENSPVFFSPEFGNISSQRMTESEMNYRNVGYVGGQGEGADREIIVIGEAEGFDRIETFIDARDVDVDSDEGNNGESLVERGSRKLSEMGKELYFEGQILTPQTKGELTENPNVISTPFIYEKDFDLGDRVPVFNKGWGVTVEAPITECKEIFEESGFQLEATFGEAQPTLISKIKNKFDELNGVEQQELSARFTKLEVQKAKEYSEGLVSEEEQKRIEEALGNLQKAKDHADEKVGEIENNIVYKVEVISSRGNIFKNDNINTVLEAKVYHGKDDVTDEFNASKFIWRRVSQDSEGDQVWNTSHAGGAKTVTITTDDVDNKATFTVELLE
jgi:hypothetical protein